jgi:hypothetical protein
LEADGRFTPDDVPIIAQAFDQILKTKQLLNRKDPAVLLVAKLTIQVAMKGERDPDRIAEAVLDQLSEQR